MREEFRRRQEKMRTWTITRRDEIKSKSKFKIDGAGDEIQDEMTPIQARVERIQQVKIDELTDKIKTSSNEKEANQARAKWIEQVKIDELTDKLEDFYQAQIDEKSDRFSGLADEQIRMIANWVLMRHWQTILPTISSHTHKATRPSRVTTKESWKDTRPALWVNHDTGQEKQRWTGGQRKERNETATPVEEEWDYILDGAAAEGNSVKNKTAPGKEEDWQWYG